MGLLTAMASTPGPSSDALSPGASQGFSLAAVVQSPTGHVVSLARGKRATIVMAMATWCHYCAYEDRWVWPRLADRAGVAIDIVDVSPYRGIARPGPEYPAFSGTDGVLRPTNTAGMAAALRRYARRDRAAGATRLHWYVAPAATRRAWNVPVFPDTWFVASAAKRIVHQTGALTQVEARTALAEALVGAPASHR